jgi:hypothetical protein
VVPGIPLTEASSSSRTPRQASGRLSLRRTAIVNHVEIKSSNIKICTMSISNPPPPPSTSDEKITKKKKYDHVAESYKYLQYIIHVNISASRYQKLARPTLYNNSDRS